MASADHSKDPLTNEKYIGDARCQKSYTTNTFPYSRKENHGEADQYYVEHTHPAIISYEDFQKVQELLKRRAERQSIPHDQTPLARKSSVDSVGRYTCGGISKAGYVTWVCRRHDRKAADCPNGRDQGGQHPYGIPSDVPQAENP